MIMYRKKMKREKKKRRRFHRKITNTLSSPRSLTDPRIPGLARRLVFGDARNPKILRRRLGNVSSLSNFSRVSHHPPPFPQLLVPPNEQEKGGGVKRKAKLTESNDNTSAPTSSLLAVDKYGSTGLHSALYIIHRGIERVE